MCAWIIAIEVAAFLLYLFVSEPTRAQFLRWGALNADTLFQGHVWKLATTVLFHESGVAFFFDMLMLWLFIPALERFWGRRRFLIFFATTVLVSNLVAALVAILLGAPFSMAAIVGITSFIYASITAYGVVYANQPVQFFGVIPIKGKVLAIGTACVVALFVLIEQAWVAGVQHFAAMATALAITKGVIAPNLWWLRWHRWRIQRRYKVIDGGAGPRRTPEKKQWLN
jgi:membrane associated rhomboid family serine protease